MAGPPILFVPLDNRPVTGDAVIELGRAAGADLRVPDRSMLGDRERAGDAEMVWRWLEREAPRGAALVASVEMLCLGGLVASRKSQAEFAEVAPRLHRLYAIASSLPTYLSAVIPRTPLEATDEDAPDSTTGRHRGRQVQLNADLIEAAAQGALRYVLIGQDDTWPGSPSQVEREQLQTRAAAVGATNVLLTSGADELNARVFARSLNDMVGASPTVRVLYTYPEEIDRIPRYEATPLRQTVDEHVRSAGCRRTEGRADILLWVHNFAGQQREGVTQTGAFDARRIDAVQDALRGAAGEGGVVALADVGYANGADQALVARLLDEPNFAGIRAYAGWNTCSNTLGSTVAQAVVAHHLQAGTVPGGGDQAYRLPLFTRLVDDWGYQSIVRPYLTSWTEERHGDAMQLGEHEATLEGLALAKLRSDALPALQRSFQPLPIAIHRVSFPWHRLFEIRLEVAGGG
jgi:uncharacterized protein DUF4127